MLKLYLISFFYALLYSQNCFAAVSFAELQQQEKKFHMQTIEIRGFLYVNSDGQMILSSEPDLKSCCQGSLKKRDSQIFIEGNVTPSLSAVTLQGVFEVDSDGQKRWLKQAVLVSKNPFSWMYHG